MRFVIVAIAALLVAGCQKSAQERVAELQLQAIEDAKVAEYAREQLERKIQDALIESERQRRIDETKTKAQRIAWAYAAFATKTHRVPRAFRDVVKMPRLMTQDSWDGPYLDESTDPTDAWGNDFEIRVDGNAITVVFGGPDETIGTDDDISASLKATSDIQYGPNDWLP